MVSYGLADFLLIFLYLIRLYEPLYHQTRLQPQDANISISSSEKGTGFRFLKFGFNEYLYKLLWFLGGNGIDIYFVTYLVGISGAGLFSFAANIVNFIMEYAPGIIIRPIVLPLFVRQYTRNKKTSEIEYLFQLHNKFIIFLTFPIFLFMGALAKEIIIYVFAPKFIPALNTLMIFLFFMFSINILIPIRNILAVLERTDISNYSAIFAILKFLLIFPFMKIYGINGAALAYGISLWGIVAFNLIKMRSFFNPVYPWKAILKILINGLIAGLVLYLLKNNISNIITLISVIFTGVITYIFLSIYNKPFNNYDRELLNKGFKIPLWHF